MQKIFKYIFLWFSLITAAASIIGGLVFLHIPIYMQIIIYAFLAFFVYDAISEQRKNKKNGPLES
ncbi:MAG: hypothetical protein WAM95_16895 [Bacillus sp. (in: firmicutes)]